MKYVIRFEFLDRDRAQKHCTEPRLHICTVSYTLLLARYDRTPLRSTDSVQTITQFSARHAHNVLRGKHIHGMSPVTSKNNKVLQAIQQRRLLSRKDGTRRDGRIKGPR